MLLLWLIEALSPILAQSSAVEKIHRFLVNLLTKQFGDAWTYLDNAWEASRIRLRFEKDFASELEEALSDGKKLDSVMVIAHSLGTVVAYEGLTGANISQLIESKFGGEGAPQLHFITIGSALNHIWRGAADWERFRFCRKLPSQVDWLNLWSDHDHVGSEPLRLPSDAWQARASASLPSFTTPLRQRRVVNQMDLFSDHSAYWNNAEEVVPPC